MGCTDLEVKMLGEEVPRYPLGRDSWTLFLTGSWGQVRG